MKQKMKEGIDSKSYTEVYEILNKLGDNFINKIPKEIFLLIEKNRDKNYKPNVFLDDSTINKDGISREALALFAFLNIAYIADDKTKEELLKIYNKNEEKLQESLKEKYEKNNIVFNKSSEEKTEEDKEKEKEEIYKEQSLTISKESLFKRIFNKIRNFFKIKK